MYNRVGSDGGYPHGGAPAYGGGYRPQRTAAQPGQPPAFQPGTYFVESQKNYGMDRSQPNGNGGLTSGNPEDVVMQQLLHRALHNIDAQLATDSVGLHVQQPLTFQHAGLQQGHAQTNALYGRHRAITFTQPHSVALGSHHVQLGSLHAPPSSHASAFANQPQSDSSQSSRSSLDVSAVMQRFATKQQASALPPRPPAQLTRPAPAAVVMSAIGDASVALGTSLYGRYRQQRQPGAVSGGPPPIPTLLEDSLKRKGTPVSAFAQAALDDEAIKRTRKVVALADSAQAMSISRSDSSSSETWLDCEESLDLDEDVESCLAVQASVHRSLSPHSVCSDPSLFVDHYSCKALVRANKVISGLHIPGGINFMPVLPSSELYHMATNYGFTAFSISLGSSYFQRLLEAIPQLRQAIGCHSKYADYSAHLKDERDTKKKGIVGVQESALQSILITCVYLAQKVADSAPGIEMLRFMLTNLYGARVSRAQAYQVEIKCLEGLKWRMGPFFMEDTPLEE